MTRTFTVYGKIRGQGRPRAFSKGKFTSVYKPKEDKLYESRIAEAYIHDCGNPAPFGEVPLMLQVTAYFAIPKAFSKAKTERASGGWIRPTKKPDLDNILKSICDALNGVAYPDDKFIVAVTFTKKYGDSEKMVVQIGELND